MKMRLGKSLRALALVSLTGGLMLPASALAFGWGTGESNAADTAYCKGLVTGGLSSDVPAGDQRTDLWLGWNHLVRSAGVGDDSNPEQFAQGRDVFANAQSAEAVEQAISNASGRCGLRRSGVWVTGF